MDGRRAVGHAALDAVPRVPGHLGNRRVQLGHRAEGAVAQAVAQGAGSQEPAHELGAEEGVLGPGDPDRHSLGLVLDGVDRPGQLLDRPRQRVGEVVEQDARRADLAVLDLVGLEGERPAGIAEERGQPDRGARLQVAVVGARPQLLEEPGGDGLDGPGQPVEDLLGGGPPAVARRAGHGRLDRSSRLT